jgi:hypothetical protein
MPKPQFASLLDLVGTSSLSYIIDVDSNIYFFPFLLPLSIFFLVGVSFSNPFYLPTMMNVLINYLTFLFTYVTNNVE